jgi:type II secretory pathway predicted ATPase ExeA
MDQDQGLRTESSERAHADSPLAVTSRRRALDRLRTAVSAGEPGHPILITGEPGAGKTWLAGQLALHLPASWMSTHVDLTRAMTALDFLQLVGHSLGIPLSDGLGAARARLHSFLHDDEVDGRRWLLIIDDAHRGSPVVWDEIRAAVNQSGRRGGFATIVVLGETELVRAMATRGFRGFASTVRLHLHLPPLDVDEARELLTFMGQGHIVADRALEELHRDVRGNASGLLRLAHVRHPGIPELSPDRTPRDAAPARPRPFAPKLTRSTVDADQNMLEIPQPASAPPIKAARAESLRSDALSLVPAKPPIRVEEGLVEVGWDGDLETEFHELEDTANAARPRPAHELSFNEELIEDPYAALQAWSEWTGGQETTASRSVAVESALARRSAEPVPVSPAPATEETGGNLEDSPAMAPPGIRAEPQHEFAPYSQLFTRLRQSKQP